MDNHDFLKIIIKENLEKQILYEGLIFSYEPTKVMRELKKKGFYNINYDGKVIKINFVLSDKNKENYEILNNFLQNLCGWFHGGSLANNVPTRNKLDFFNHEIGNVILQYEPKFDIELFEIPNHLYHLTTCDKLKKMQKIGLTPHNSTEYFNFENRIYFSLDKEKLKEFAQLKSSITENKCFVILDVQLNGFTNRIRFFKDPNFKNGIYTLQNIPPQTIE